MQHVPPLWCSLALLALTAPLQAQEAPVTGPLASLSLNDPGTPYPFPTPGHTLPRDTGLPHHFAANPAVDPAHTPPPLHFLLNPVLSAYPNLPPAGDAPLLAETGLAWQLAPSRLPGHVTIGIGSDPAAADAADRPSFPGGSRPTTWTPYLVLDQTLWRANPHDPRRDPRALGLFLLYDHPNADLFPTTEHFAAGLSFTGLTPDRPDDLLGVGLSYAHLTSDPAADFSKGSETAVEVFYRLQLTPRLTLRPELRYVLDPATEDAASAVVASVQLEFEY